MTYDTNCTINNIFFQKSFDFLLFYIHYAGETWKKYQIIIFSYTMENIELKAQKRDNSEKNTEIRANKMIPGVVYGRELEPMMIKIDGIEFLKINRKVSGSHIIKLKVDTKDIDVLIHETQVDPLKWDFTHVDFYAVTANQTVDVEITLNFVGDSQAKRDGCIITTQHKSILVRCSPKDLVDGFDVDMTLLAADGDVIKVSDLGIDKNKYHILTPETDVIATAATVEEEVIDNAAPESGIEKTEAELAAEKAAAEKREEKKGDQ